jgi:hypothetical protein
LLSGLSGPAEVAQSAKQHECKGLLL